MKVIQRGVMKITYEINIKRQKEIREDVRAIIRSCECGWQKIKICEKCGNKIEMM